MVKDSPKVSLDALIPREAFEVEDQQAQTSAYNIDKIPINNLRQNDFFYPFLRKPDFQRETNEWDAQRICDFIESFLDGDLIPAIILWRSNSGYFFVIDGSHRLSALIAWLNDDYGDGKISNKFYDGYITNEQKNAAIAARKLIKDRIGSYEDYNKLLMQGRDAIDTKTRGRIINLGSLGIQVQWVGGNASKAANSFFLINQKAAPISPTEMRLLKARKKANGVASRAIMRSGNGHKYWSDFSQEKQKKIEELAQEIHQIIFEPKLENPIKTTDVPLVGNISTFQKNELILEFVNIVNDIEAEKELDLEDDSTGDKTIKFLINCRKIARRINSNHPSSLGLHPLIYFYTRDGRYRVGSFYGAVSLILHLEKTKSYDKFIKCRKNFELLIWQHDDIVPQIVSKSSVVKARAKVKDFYLAIIEKLTQDVEKKNIVKDIIVEGNFGSIKTKPKVNPTDNQNKTFSRETKAATFIRDALPKVIRCKICGGYLHSNSISIDHKIRKEDGGLGKLDNAQLTHPYCNTTFKN
ncbi:HNH endonuclease family protein [Nostoc parmelioides]|uniref:DUF262 domain-containing protein n=1 Tax=Nostoc parmelioides FACHB-3921 TaxID=2692909 RepID=A0ABR8BC74_9NOSO|nr:DUF262 domain-containing protein [Nostoc parmelioides]MBD2251683.1 DUF262 domain-containing protein [Nostoc parmelioides FACHB-3921]